MAELDRLVIVGRWVGGREPFVYISLPLLRGDIDGYGLRILYILCDCNA